MDERGASEADLRAWLERRFPQDGAAGDRLDEVDRRWRRRRRLMVGLPAVVVLLPLAGFVVARLVTGGPRPARTPAPPSVVERHPVLLGLVIVLWVVAVAAEFWGIRRMRRALRPLKARPEARVLRGLPRHQRAALLKEVRGQAPVVPGDELLLDHLARVLVANSWYVVVIGAVGLLTVTNLVVQSDRPSIVLVLLVASVLLIATGAVLVLRDRRRALEYLRRRERDQARVPLAP